MKIGGMKASFVAAGVMAIGIVLGGCSATPTVTTASTPATSTPATTPSMTPSTAATDGPLDAQSAWNACSVVADREYISQNPGATVAPFASNNTLETDGDGNTVIVVSMIPPEPIEGVGFIAMICTMSGTMNDPQVVKWMMKDI